MYQITYTNRMKRDTKRMKKRGKDLTKLITALNLLAAGIPMPESYHDHQLSGNLQDFRECHIEPDWLLLYQFHEDYLIITATATGTHADLFK